MATHSSILSWRIPWIEEPAGYSPWGRKESDTTERLHILLTLSPLHQAPPSSIWGHQGTEQVLRTSRARLWLAVTFSMTSVNPLSGSVSSFVKWAGGLRGL